MATSYSALQRPGLSECLEALQWRVFQGPRYVFENTCRFESTPPDFCHRQNPYPAELAEDSLHLTEHRHGFTLTSSCKNCEFNLWMWLCISFQVTVFVNRSSSL